MAFETNDYQKMNSMPYVGEQAPHFNANSTQENISLDDYKGKWFILFAHPSDFDPVSTSEFVALQVASSKLRELNVEVVGISVDNITSHVAWLNSIEETFDTQIEFPLIADLNKQISTDYGMLSKESNGSETSRVIFIIDEDSVVRSVIDYPATIGRNINEILRVIKALKTTDKTEHVTPANWETGDKILAPSPSIIKDAKNRMENPDYECKNWYYCEKDSDDHSKSIYNAFLQDK
ncbi:peroxiredoxin [Staphylococcus nepalensis]|uniref:peroxiredoxin n=1 Tax=Staphylococcus nepalensis TaxID=214473 RepID=UPI0011CC9169|nr:peroxiredoxin [Staphylococcus nepalensis]